MREQKTTNSLTALLLSFVLILSSVLTGFTTRELESAAAEINKYTGNGYTVEYVVVSKWDGAYVGKIIVTNTSSEDIEDWKLTFNSKDQITNIWDAKIISHDNNTYQLSNAGYNQDIEAGKSISFGFNASYDSKITIPEEYSANYISTIAFVIPNPAIIEEEIKDKKDKVLKVNKEALAIMCPINNQTINVKK